MRVSSIALIGLGLLVAGCDGETGIGSQSNDVASPPEHRWEPEAVKEGNLRVATFNVRNFPEEAPVEGETAQTSSTSAVTHLDATDLEVLLDVLDQLDFDALALQEIRDPEAFREVLLALGEREGASFESAFTENLASGNGQQVGIVVRADKLALVEPVEHPEVDVKGTLRAGLSARLVSRREGGGVDLGVMVLHLASGDSVKRADLRALQAAASAEIVTARSEAFLDDDFLILGDLNTARAEREFPALDAAFGLTRLDNPDGCTSYFVKNKLGQVNPSWIDHAYAAALDEIDPEVPLTSGAHCAERRCQPFESDGPESGTTYWAVSDHCPVYFELRDVDSDPPAP